MRNFLLINALPSEYHADCHIKGSINVPLANLEEFAKKLEKDTEIIVYCARYTCPVSRKAWHVLHKLGFTNVKAYEGGILEWFKAGLPTEGACKMDYLSDPAEKPVEGNPEVVTISMEELKKKVV